MFDSRRHAIRLLKPTTQLKLPLLLLLLALGLGASMAWHTHAAYERIYTTTISQAPADSRADIQQQTRDFLIVSGAMLGGYVLVLLGICISYTHDLIGPLVALERHAERLRLGDFTARARLRKRDTVFADLAREMNALSELLEKHATDDSSASWRS